MTQETLPYGLWDPLLTPEEIYVDITQFTHVVTDERGNTYWAELRPEEDGRIVVVKWTEKEGTRDISPSGFNVRTRVHEYGGRAFVVSEDVLYFSNFDDQRLYKQDIESDSAPTPITPERLEDGSLGKCAAPVLSPDGNTLVFVLEKEFEDRENENYIAAINLQRPVPQEPIILVSGSDFYGDPVLSPDGERIAWIQWDHPRMPWEGTELWHAKFNGVGKTLESAERIAGSSKTAICFPSFGPDGELFFIMDEAGHARDDPKNWWNIYSHRHGKTEPVTQQLAEFGGPMWILGYSRYVLDGRTIHALCHRREGDLLAHISLDASDITWTGLPYDTLAMIQKGEGSTLLLLAAASDRPAAIITYDTETEKSRVLRESFKMPFDPEQVSQPNKITFPTQDGEYAHAILYQPHNPNFRPPADTKPPLIVQVHGGPTGSASTMLSLGNQFWTSMGYAVLDVDHRGSTGYGREYRDRLFGRWGIIDAKDVHDGIEYLLEQDKVSPKIAIRGGSAGGYAVQRCLTMFPDLFKAGASYFGIGNLITLVRLTHKFESRYLDSLLGVSLEESEEVYRERSPVNHLESLKAPMILFQGLEDKIVTPEVSREIVKLLDEKGIKHEYVEYEGESHGFRKKETRIDALRKESEFYREVLFNHRELGSGNNS
ncbi:S9 family peptidase [Candidatus Thorarchaeota archaeon]|nr:MAG: S9 family peptidase [Candidatus Thorarchaeota archaeon]